MSGCEYRSFDSRRTDDWLTDDWLTDDRRIDDRRIDRRRTAGRGRFRLRESGDLPGRVSEVIADPLDQLALRELPFCKLQEG